LYPEQYNPDVVAGSLSEFNAVPKQIAQGIAQQRADDTNENQDQSRAERISHDKEMAELRRIAIANGSNRPPKVTTIQSYTGEDGYQHTVRSDGSEIVSKVKVRQTGSGGRPRPGGVDTSGWHSFVKN